MSKKPTKDQFKKSSKEGHKEGPRRSKTKSKKEEVKIPKYGEPNFVPQDPIFVKHFAKNIDDPIRNLYTDFLTKSIAFTNYGMIPETDDTTVILDSLHKDINAVDYALRTGKNLYELNIYDHEAIETSNQTRKEALEAYEKLSNYVNKQHYLLYETNAADNGTGRYTTITPDSVKNTYLKMVTKFSNQQKSGRASDTDLDYVFELFDQEEELPPYHYVMWPRTYLVKDNEGSYFHFTHKTKHDLTSLQILKESDSIELHNEVNKEHCLVSSMIYSAPPELRESIGFKNLMQRFRTQIGLTNFKTVFLKKILPDWICLRITKFKDDMSGQRGNNSYAYYSSDNIGNKKETVTHTLKLVLFRKHYMPDLDIVPGLKIGTREVLRRLVRENLLVSSHFTAMNNGELFDLDILNNYDISSDQKIYQYEQLPKIRRNIYFGDFEAIANKQEQRHLPFLFGYVGLDSDEPKTFKAKSKEDVEKCLIFTNGLNKIIKETQSRSELSLEFVDYLQKNYKPSQNCHDLLTSLYNKLMKDKDYENHYKYRKYIVLVEKAINKIYQTKGECIPDSIVTYNDVVRKYNPDQKEIRQMNEDFAKPFPERFQNIEPKFAEDYILVEKESDPGLGKYFRYDTVCVKKPEGVALTKEEWTRLNRRKIKEWCLEKPVPKHSEYDEPESENLEFKKNLDDIMFAKELIEMQKDYIIEKRYNEYLARNKAKNDNEKKKFWYSYYSCLRYRTSLLNRVLKNPTIDLKTLGRFIKYEEEANKNEIVIYFHNLKYDFAHIKRNTFITITKETSRNGQLYSIRFIYKKMMFKLVDSYKIISKPLSSFKKDFDLNFGKKEFELYDLVTRKNYNKDYIPLIQLAHNFGLRNTTALRKKNPETDAPYIDEDLNKYIDWNSQRFYHINHYVDYLKWDCITLKEGMKKMDWALTRATGLSVFDYLTISSLSFTYGKKMGCLDGCAEISGHLQLFMKLFVTGGRVCTQYNRKIKARGRIQSIDARSLYPSAMAILNMPKGFCEVIKKSILNGTKLDMNVLKKYSQYMVACTIKVNKRQQIPTVSYLKDGVRHWTNEIPENEIVYLDRIGLEDAIKYHKIDITSVKIAIGWPVENGFNNKIGQVMQDLKKQRDLNGSKSLIGEQIKLVMNSFYGKSLLGDCEHEIVYKRGDTQFESFLTNNYSRFVSARSVDGSVGEKAVYRIKVNKKIVGNTNFAHFGVFILSTSKRIMNEMMSIANENKFPIFYTDTDSAKLFEADMHKLVDLFREEFGRELVGNELGQFALDFESKKIFGGLHATEFIGLGKKTYLAILQNDKGETDYYVRFKGAHIVNIEGFCAKQQISIPEFYERLFNEEKLTVDLTDGKVRFKHHDDGVETVQKMEKSFQFLGNKEYFGFKPTEILDDLKEYKNPRQPLPNMVKPVKVNDRFTKVITGSEKVEEKSELLPILKRYKVVKPLKIEADGYEETYLNYMRNYKYNTNHELPPAPLTKIEMIEYSKETNVKTIETPIYERFTHRKSTCLAELHLEKIAKYDANPIAYANTIF